MGEERPHDFLDNTTLPDFLDRYNLKTRQIRRLRQLLRPQSQILGASVDGDWLTWSEADNQPGFTDWALFVYNLRTGVIRQIAQAARPSGQPVSGPAPAPIVNHNQLIWEQSIGPVKNNNNTLSNIVVRMEDLTPGQVTTLATKAGNPLLSWLWAIWDQVNTSTDGHEYETMKNLETGQTAQWNGTIMSLLSQAPASPTTI